MKNALILHGTKANPHSNWFDWFKGELEKSGYKVWVPELPGADQPDMATYQKFLLASNFDFNDETLIVGHSSGALAVLSLLEVLDKKIDTAVMVGVYRPEERSYSTGGPIDTQKVKGKAKRFVFVHSDDDPVCPLEGAKYFAEALGGELVVLPGNQHFAVQQDPKHNKLPELVRILHLEATP